MLLLPREPMYKCIEIMLITMFNDHIVPSLSKVSQLHYPYYNTECKKKTANILHQTVNILSIFEFF